jgi:HAD superfamily hydrolase (TIGR01450 family)
VHWVLDLDGVVWLAEDPIPGAADAIHDLREAGEHVVFVTNNSNPTEAEYEAKLARHGIDARGSVISSAMAAADLIQPGERALVFGGPGIVEALDKRGAAVVDDGPADVVLVGFHREFDYDRMRRASDAVRAGARLIATNDDATYPTGTGVIPGAGAILAGIEKASGVHAVVAGKPNAPIADTVRRRLGPGDGMVIGDRLDTDGRLARALGFAFALVLTGVTRPDEVADADPRPDEVADDLAAVVARYVANR